MKNFYFVLHATTFSLGHIKISGFSIGFSPLTPSHPSSVHSFFHFFSKVFLILFETRQFIFASAKIKSYQIVSNHDRKNFSASIGIRPPRGFRYASPCSGLDRILSGRTAVTSRPFRRRLSLLAQMQACCFRFGSSFSE